MTRQNSSIGRVGHLRIAQGRATGIVVDDVELPVALEHGTDCPLHLGRLGDVGGHKGRFADRTRLLLGLGPAALVDVRDDHPRAFLREQHGSAAADSRRGSGYERDLAVESIHSNPPFPLRLGERGGKRPAGDEPEVAYCDPTLRSKEQDR